MPRLRYSERSRADLDAIWEFIASECSRNATTVLGRLHAKIDQLRTQPLIGHQHRDLQRGVRCLNRDGYLILHRYAAGVVLIDRIVHHSRDLPTLPLGNP